MDLAARYRQKIALLSDLFEMIQTYDFKCEKNKAYLTSLYYDTLEQ